MNRRVIFALFLLLPLVVALTGGCACMGGRSHYRMGHASMMSCSKDCGGAGQACCKMRTGASMQMGGCCKGQQAMSGCAPTASRQMGSATRMSCGPHASCANMANCSPTGCDKPNCCKKQGAWGKARSGCPLPADQCWGYCRHSVAKASGSSQGCAPAGCATPCASQKTQAGTVGCAPGCGAKG